MADTKAADPINLEPTQNDPIDLSNLSLESLVLLLNTERLDCLKESARKELDELKKRQADVKKLHDALRAINSATDDKGKLDLSKNKELQEHFKNAKELGIDVRESKGTYTKEERDRLVENIRILVDDLNVENDLQLQTLSKLTNERYESYQMARSILKPLSDAKQRAAREISGRGG